MQASSCCCSVGCNHPVGPVAAPSPRPRLLATPNDHPQVVVNSLGMRLVAIPAGRFWMGSAEPARELGQAHPRRNATLSPPVMKPPCMRCMEPPVLPGPARGHRGAVPAVPAQSGYQPESVFDGTGGYGYNPQYDPAATQRGDAEGRDPRYSWRNQALHRLTTTPWSTSPGTTPRPWRSG